MPAAPPKAAAPRKAARRRARPANAPAATGRPVEGSGATGFGFDPAGSLHHFRVWSPPGAKDPVEISEHTTWDRAAGSSPVSLGPRVVDGALRVRLSRAKWDAVADPVRDELNRRLRAVGEKPGRFKRGETLLSREFGKELVLLAWAVEDAEIAAAPVAVANWLGLEPEERWWLYTMTAAASGHYEAGRDRGWRKAVRFALTENPSSAVFAAPAAPEWFSLAAEAA